MSTIPVSVIVLTRNEEANIEACLRSVRDWAGDLFVVDSGSTDRTVTLAAALGATVVEHPFMTHAQQWAWALEALPCRHEWILGLDADQRVTPQLAGELRGLLAGPPAAVAGVDGFYVNRRQVFRGRWIRWGGYYPKYLLKLFRRGRVRMDPNDLVDHYFHVEGRTARLRHDLIEENKKEDQISFWTAKHTHYARLMAQEELRRRARPGGDSFSSERWMKRLWWRLPLYLRPFLYFSYRYVVRLGFLDGKEGLVFHFLQGCWFRFLVDVNLDEFRRADVVPSEEIASVDYPRH